MKIKLLIILLVSVLILVACVPIETTTSSHDGLTMIAKQGVASVWKMADNNGVTTTYCYVLFNVSAPVGIFCR